MMSVFLEKEEKNLVVCR